ncbi:MAG TPA: SIR2 family protein [Pyrinomonadaceae bacterium]|jgi:hypothetical protein|nr:SIR2 family protein [Pyrinomonadaceae bacterium]
MKTLSDQIYIKQLRQKLWANGGTGRAAMMIGSGFSRNADALSPRTPAFPLWVELAQAMAIELYPTTADTNAKKDPLRLATEYESVFGRDALNSLIARAIPDADYKPSLLHRMLLSLPWSDVFTTNYDTLLERTLPDIHDRKYDIVLTPTDLPAYVKPRIVKLHGSFPSHLPFIITQEDFRTYPREFAPFVNTVQQSIIENALCLVGFSGEDPNFLHWTGWVRDNLGKLSPPIYLCSLFEISPSERRVLEKRNVFPIDLSTVIEKSEIPDDNLRFTKILEWFLLELWNGASLNNLNYPRLERRNRWTSSYGVPASSDDAEPENDLGIKHPNGIHVELSEGELREIQNRWRIQRKAYPGWVILPADNRERLWQYTEYWIHPVLRSLGKLPPSEILSLLYELNQRLEKCLLPILSDQAEKNRQIVSRFNPFPAFLNQEAEFQPNNAAGLTLNWGQISREWTELTFALMRRAREQFDDAEFHEYVERLRNIVRQDETWEARWFYERCLFALFRLDHEEARKILLEWDKNLGNSFWHVKRAAILAEIGEIEQAENLAEAALSSIRMRQQPFAQDYTLLAQEGWTLLLLKGIKDNSILIGNKAVGEYRDRWEQLAVYHCNPWIDLENFELKVKNLDPRPKPARTVGKGFLPTEETISYSLISSSELEKTRLALSFLRMFEEAGLPFRSNRVLNFSEAVTNAAICLADSDLEQTISTIIRTEKTDEINRWFQYHHVANLSETLVNRFFDLFSASFLRAIERYQQSLGNEALQETALRRIKLFAELMSRLSHRLSLVQLERVFSYAEQIYVHPIFTNNFWLHESVAILFKRVLEAMSSADIFTHIYRLLSLPLPTEGGFQVAQPQTWSDPFERIRWKKDFKLPEGHDRSTWDPVIENLIRIIRSGPAEARKRAIIRLATLHEIKILNANETTEFARAIWSRIDPETRLPVETNLEMSSLLLYLPNPDTEETKQLLRNHFTTRDFPRAIHRHMSGEGQEVLSVGIGTGANSLFENIISLTLQPYSDPQGQEKLIDWSEAETKDFLDKTVALWDEEKPYLNRFSGREMADDNVRHHFLQLADFVALVLLPRLTSGNADTIEIIRRVLDEMQAANLFPLSALPLKLFIVPEEADEIFSKVLKGLRSLDQEQVRDAAHGTRNWLFYAQKSGLAEFPKELLNELINIAVLRRQPGLLSVIKILVWIAKTVPEVFDESHFAHLIIVLEFLRSEIFFTDFLESIENQNIEESERAAFQNACRQLAKAIKQFYENNGGLLPDTMNFWFTDVQMLS